MPSERAKENQVDKLTEERLALVNRMVEAIGEYSSKQKCSHCGKIDWDIIQDKGVFVAALAGVDWVKEEAHASKHVRGAILICDSCGSIWLLSTNWVMKKFL